MSWFRSARRNQRTSVRQSGSGLRVTQTQPLVSSADWTRVVTRQARRSGYVAETSTARYSLLGSEPCAPVRPGSSPCAPVRCGALQSDSEIVPLDGTAKPRFSDCVTGTGGAWGTALVPRGTSPCLSCSPLRRQPASCAAPSGESTSSCPITGSRTSRGSSAAGSSSATTSGAGSALDRAARASIVRHLLTLRQMAPQRPMLWQVVRVEGALRIAPSETPAVEDGSELLSVFESHLCEVESIEGVDVAAYLAACFE